MLPHLLNRSDESSFGMWEVRIFNDSSEKGNIGRLGTQKMYDVSSKLINFWKIIHQIDEVEKTRPTKNVSYIRYPCLKLKGYANMQIFEV